MKVLWLVSITIPAAADACGLQAKEIGGGWLSGALGGMTAAPDAPAITVASVDARAETLTVCSKNGVSFALVPTGSVENFSALLKKIAPDLVHIWGTEYAAARTIQQAAQAAGSMQRPASGSNQSDSRMKGSTGTRLLQITKDRGL